MRQYNMINVLFIIAADLILTNVWVETCLGLCVLEAYAGVPGNHGGSKAIVPGNRAVQTPER